MKPPAALLVAHAAQGPWLLASLPLRPSAAEAVSGILLIALGVAINVAAARQFERQAVSVCPFGETPVLIEGGLYRISRHPMYVGLVAVLLGAVSLSGAWGNAWTVVAYASWLRGAFVIPEERFLRRRFGQQFDSYALRTPRWLGIPLRRGDSMTGNVKGHRAGLRAALGVVVTLFVGAVALLWAWNSVAVGVFQAPPVRFRHALALEAALVAAVLVPALILRFSRSSRPSA